MSDENDADASDTGGFGVFDGLICAAGKTHAVVVLVVDGEEHRTNPETAIVLANALISGAKHATLLAAQAEQVAPPPPNGQMN